MTMEPEDPTAQRLVRMAFDAESLVPGQRRADTERLFDNPAFRRILVPAALDELAQAARQRVVINEVQEHQRKLEFALKKFEAPPGIRALLIGLEQLNGSSRAVVAVGGGRLLEVEVSNDVDTQHLFVGATVVLSHEMNCIVAHRAALWPGGAIAGVDRVLQDGRLVLLHRDEQVVVDCSQRLRDEGVRAGDHVRFEPTIALALEKAEPPQMQELWLEHTPAITFDDIGGLGPQIAELLEGWRIQMSHPDLFTLYRLEPVLSALLTGPPGCGKTMTAKALCNYLGRLSGNGSRFINVKPGELESMWVGQSESNYRALFRTARKAAADQGLPVVIFMDEVESIGRTRGGIASHAHDNSLTAFLAELSGLEERGNVFCLAATNRPDLLDPALLRPGRLGDMPIRIGRPDRAAAIEIFGKYLRGLPLAVAGNAQPEGRMQEILEPVVGRLYSFDGVAEIGTAMFRDGTRQVLRAADLMSGAIIAKVVAVAARQACRRHIQEATKVGITPEDLLESADRELRTLVSHLKPHNLGNYIELPDERVDEVVAVEPVRRGAPAHRYVRTEVAV
jgi:proteasome-associated ATPase